MATLLHATSFRVSTDPESVTIPAAAAGATLVCVAYGGAVVTAKLGAGGASFTKRDPTSLNAFEVSCQDIVCAGGETTVQIDTNAARVIDGVIYEFAAGSLGAFLTGVAPDSSITADAARNYTPGNLTVGEQALVFVAACKSDATSTPARRWWGLEPLGRVDRNAHNAGTDAFWGQVGIADVETGTHRVATSSVVTGGVNQMGAWAYASATTTVDLDDNPVVRENTLPGSYHTSWHGATTNANIAGYTGSTSYAPGETVDFRVDSDDVGFNVEIHRVGAYGYHPFGGRRVATVTGSPAVQPAPTVNARGGSVCAWSTTASWAVPADACPGVYVANIRRTDNSAFVAPVMFVVRSTKPSTKQADRMCLRTADYTWAAYNMWGARSDFGTSANQSGRSLYGAGTLSSGGAGNAEKRAFSASFDRPFGTKSNQGNTWWDDSEISLVNFLEANGYWVDYYSCTDIDADPQIPSRYQVAVVSGHDEYYTDGLYDAYAEAIAAGTHVFVCSGNTAFWRVRFAGGDDREMICYKDTHDVTGFDNTTKYDPVDYTGTWRDSRTNVGGVNNTHRQPESGLFGQWFVANAPQAHSVEVPFAYQALPIWRGCAPVQTLTSGQTWTSTRTNLVGDEWDYVKADEPTTPANLVLLHHKDVALVGQAASPNGDTYAGSGTFRQGASLFRHNSGALVFNTGSWRWAVGLSRFRLGAVDTSGAVEPVVQQATINLLADLGLSPPTLLDTVRNEDATVLVDPGPAADPTEYGLTVTTGPSWSEWDGADEAPLALDGVWDGSAVQSVGAVEIT